MTSTVIEFDVELKCGGCEKEIRRSLSGLGGGVGKVEVMLDKGCVLVETSLPSSRVAAAIEATGRRAVLKGYGSAGVFKDGGLRKRTLCAVAILGGESGYSEGSVRGVVRLVETGEESGTVIEGTLDGLAPGHHGLHIHECGDISQGCHSVGDHYNPFNSPHGGPGCPPQKRHVGDLGNIVADDSGRAEFRLEEKLVKVDEVIGRSIVVTGEADDLGTSSHPMSPVDGNSGPRLACGIISRSAGLFENSKRICACDGVTLWQERDRPLAGPNRRHDKPKL